MNNLTENIIISNNDTGSVRYLAMICFVASLGGVLFGFDTAVISGTISMVEAQFGLDKIAVGWFGSSALVGAIIGSLMAGTLGDRFGRRPILIISAILFFLSALGSSIPPSFVLLIPARLLGGLAIGIASVLAPLYISEFAPSKYRGRLVALYQLSIVIGVLLAYFSNWLLLGFSQDNGTTFSGSEVLHQVMISEVWRAMFGAEMIPAALFLFFLLIIPESPRWLVKEGRKDDAQKILEKIRGKSAAATEIQAIHDVIEEKSGSLRELLKPGFRTALIAGLGLSIFGQFTGVNIIVYYGPDILEAAGFNFNSALKFQVAIGLISLIFTVLAMWKIDRWGRRPLLIGGMASVAVSLVILGILFSLSNANGVLILIMLCVYMASLAFSINAVIWVLLGEIYPTRIRGRAMSIATFANWGTNFSTAFIFPWFVTQIGMGAGFFVFAGFCLIATIFFYKVIPETKGKSLEEIEKYWSTEKKIESLDKECF